MNLGILLDEIGVCLPLYDREVTGVTENIANVCEGSVFVAVKGRSCDGNSFVDEAIEKGAVCIVSETAYDFAGSVKTDDARLALSKLCSAFYSHPERQMKMIGITGTNGKTTVCEYLTHILAYSGRKCASIGTLGSKSDEHFFETGYTTPSPEILYKELAAFHSSGCEYCVMEVSSQALQQKRADPISFHLSVFTNIGTDHLDWHGSFENYLSAKARLFTLSQSALVNADDANSETVASGCNGKVYTYSAKDRFADFSAKDVRYAEDRISYIFFDKKHIIPVKMNGTGEFDVYNTLAAVSAAGLLGIPVDVISEAIECLPSLKGRMQKINADGITVYIDFAHTPQALRAVLESLRKVCKNKLICVFGCGGNRDKNKRAAMGKTAAALSDTVIITNDNPRNEAPENITRDILSGISNKRNTVVEPDRENAIAYALKKAKYGDTVLIAGKGHEEYQCIGSEKKYFSDEMTVKKILGLN